MIYITNALPNYCPKCGCHHNNVWKEENRQDFLKSISMGCACGAMFQYAPTQDMLELAQLHGDLHKFIARE
ncbi:hypothetical protein [Leeia oryzae]|uniref:hypothetical protein n=1 Tax=Leeia oryzae TaxID=356662 RepID=UPI00035E193B|nr:hypothetical protein [Leeia oryzae]